MFSIPKMLLHHFITQNGLEHWHLSPMELTIFIDRTLDMYSLCSLYIFSRIYTFLILGPFSRR